MEKDRFLIGDVVRVKTTGRIGLIENWCRGSSGEIYLYEVTLLNAMGSLIERYDTYREDALESVCVVVAPEKGGK